jgi:hypothetical protein
MLQPDCMFCKKNLPMDFVIDNNTKKFFNDYTEYRSQIIFSREQSRLPEAQLAIEKEKKLSALAEEYKIKKQNMIN